MKSSLPHPRSINAQPGFYTLPDRPALHLDVDPVLVMHVMLPIAERLQSAAEAIGVHLELISGPARTSASGDPRVSKHDRLPTIQKVTR